MADDFTSMLAIGQGWSQVNKPEEARKILSQIPAYAAEYPAAQISIATIDEDAGNADAAVKSLEKLRGMAGIRLHGRLGAFWFQAYFGRRGKHPEAGAEAGGAVAARDAAPANTRIVADGGRCMRQAAEARRARAVQRRR